MSQNPPLSLRAIPRSLRALALSGPGPEAPGSDPRLPRVLQTEAFYPGNGLPPRPGEDRPGLSPFGRLAMGGLLGKSSILIYDSRVDAVQEAPVDMIYIGGDDLDAWQLSVTLHPPRVISMPFDEVKARLDQQNLTGEQTNSDVTFHDFPGADKPIRWPPLEAQIEFGVGGVNTTVTVDFVNGVTLNVIASFLRVRAVVTQSRHCGDIFGTSAAYYLAAHVGPGFAEAHAQRTIFVGDVDDKHESDVLDLPKFSKIATLIGCRAHHHRVPTLTIGWIRFFQDPRGRHCVGDFFVSDHQDHVEVPNAAQYFSVFNESGHKMKLSVIFELGL
jgi:hypothetical protein